jgi:hypothetical protein
MGPAPRNWRAPPQLIHHMPFYTSPTVCPPVLSFPPSLAILRTPRSIGRWSFCILSTRNSMSFRSARRHEAHQCGLTIP